MSWRYSAYRDLSGSRDTSSSSGVSSLAAKFGSTERLSRWSKTNEPTKTTYTSTSERPPIYTKPSTSEGTSSVLQRLRDRYSSDNKSEKTYDRSPKVSESKDISSSTGSRYYGRSTSREEPKTSKSYEEKKDHGAYGSLICRLKEKEPEVTTYRSTYRKRVETSPEPEKPTYEYKTRKPDYTQHSQPVPVSSYAQPLERPKIYTSSSLGSSPSTTKYLGGLERNKLTTTTAPTSPTVERSYKRFDSNEAKEEPNDEYVMVSMTTRATSPTPPSPSVYVRTRRADSNKVLEKQISRSKIRPSSENKETQADIAEDKSGNDTMSARSKWSSYTPVSRYSGRVGSYSSREPTVSTSRRNDYLTNSYTSRVPEYKSVRTEEAPKLVEKIEVENKVQVETPEKIEKSSSPKSPEPSYPPPKRPSVKKKSSVSPVKLRKSTSKSDATEPNSDEKSMSPGTQFTMSPEPAFSPLKKSPSVKSKENSPSTRRSPSIPKLNVTLQQKEDNKEAISLISALENVIVKQETEQKPKEELPKLKSNVCVNNVEMNKGEVQETSSSSASESSSDEDTDSSDESESATKEPTITSNVKRSITNFLQNIPTIITRKADGSSDSINRTESRDSLNKRKNRSIAKLKFKSVESGERAWWLDSHDNVPEGVARIKSNKSMNKLQNDVSNEDWWSKINTEVENNTLTIGKLCLAKQISTDDFWAKLNTNDITKNQSNSSIKNLPPKVPSTNRLQIDIHYKNRQYSPDQDWLKGSSDSVSVKLDDNSNVEMIKQNDVNHNDSIWLTRNETPVSGSVVTNGLQYTNSELVNGDDVSEEIDVTPALRRWREHQQTSPQDYQLADYEMKITQNKNDNNDKKILEDFKMENSVKEIAQILVQNQNGCLSPTEEKNMCITEEGDMSGMINKAKAELLKTKGKNDIRQSPTGEIQIVSETNQSEIEIYWKELVDSLDRPLKLYDLDFTDLNSDDENDVMSNFRHGGDMPPPPPLFIMMLPTKDQVPVPPPHLNGGPPPPRNAMPPPTPPMPTIVKNKKTVKLFWKEVKDDPLAKIKIPNDSSMLWDELSPVIVDNQKLEHLFESRAKDLIAKKQQDQNKSKEIYVLDPKRSNAINIGMTKLPPPRSIKTAILKMDATIVNREGIEKLLTMLPSEEERMRIQDAQSANPELPLGSAEQFLLTLASISELEARLRLWAFKLDFENSEKEIAEPLMDLKQGIEILKINKTFRCILSTLLSIGNFLNGIESKGFQIDYLSKVPEVKDTVNKHSLLHHLCVIVMEKFPDSTDLYSEIGSVTRASKVDFDELSANIKKVEDECKCSWNHLKVIAKHEGHTAIKMKMSDFLADCAERIIVLGIVHKRVINRFQKFVFWLGIPINRISTTKPNEICRIVSEFALEYRTTRERVLQQIKKLNHHREKSRTRYHVNNDVSSAKKLNSKQAKDDAELRQLLNNNSTNSDSLSRTATWRRQRKEIRNELPNDVATHDNDNEIIETLIKTANQYPSSRVSVKERRRSRISDRK